MTTDLGLKTRSKIQTEVRAYLAILLAPFHTSKYIINLNSKPAGANVQGDVNTIPALCWKREEAWYNLIINVKLTIIPRVS
jgi:hypothetical protein